MVLTGVRHFRHRGGYPLQHHRAADQKDKARADTEALTSGQSGDGAMASGAVKAVILPEKEKKPKNSVVFSAGLNLASSVRLAASIGPEAIPIRMAKAR